MILVHSLAVGLRTNVFIFFFLISGYLLTLSVCGNILIMIVLYLGELIFLDLKQPGSQLTMIEKHFSSTSLRLHRPYFLEKYLTEFVAYYAKILIEESPVQILEVMYRNSVRLAQFTKQLRGFLQNSGCPATTAVCNVETQREHHSINPSCHHNSDIGRRLSCNLYFSDDNNDLIAGNNSRDITTRLTDSGNPF